jgi:hypothetical protein
MFMGSGVRDGEHLCLPLSYTGLQATWPKIFPLQHENPITRKAAPTVAYAHSLVAAF